MSDISEKDVEKEQFVRQFEAGRFLKLLRGARPLTEVCKSLGVSTAYLSEVERGKLPSDHFLSVAASTYETSEDDLFFRWGKMPILARQTVTENKTLLSTIAEIGRNNKLDDSQKQRLYDSIYRTYQEFIREIEWESGKKERRS